MARRVIRKNSLLGRLYNKSKEYERLTGGGEGRST